MSGIDSLSIDGPGVGPKTTTQRGAAFARCESSGYLVTLVGADIELFKTLCHPRLTKASTKQETNMSCVRTDSHGSEGETRPLRGHGCSVKGVYWIVPTRQPVCSLPSEGLTDLKWEGVAADLAEGVYVSGSVNPFGGDNVILTVPHVFYVV